MKTSFPIKVLSIAIYILSFTIQIFAQGIPEPPLIFYGGVFDDRVAPAILKTNGTLRVVLLSSANESLTYTTTLQPIEGGYSFIVALPAETSVAGFSDSTNHLRLKTPALTYTIASVTLDGTQMLFLPSHTPASFPMNADTRGSIRLLNLFFARPASLVDTDGDGLDDNWERLYFGNLSPVE